MALFGKVDTYRGGLQMANPIVDLIGDRTGRIVPIYPQSEKAQLNTWELAGWVEEALRRCHDRGIADPVPEAIRRPAGTRRSRRGAGDDPHPRVDARQGHRPPAAGVRRAAAGPARARDAQARAGADLARAVARGRRRARAALPRRLAVPADGGPAARDRRDRGRPRRAQPDAPPAAGRRRIRQDRRRRVDAAARRAGRAPGCADGARPRCSPSSTRPACGRCSAT